MQHDLHNMILPVAMQNYATLENLVPSVALHDVTPNPPTKGVESCIIKCDLENMVACVTIHLACVGSAP